MSHLRRGDSSHRSHALAGGHVLGQRVAEVGRPGPALPVGPAGAGLALDPVERGAVQLGGRHVRPLHVWMNSSTAAPVLHPTPHSHVEPLYEDRPSRTKPAMTAAAPAHWVGAGRSPRSSTPMTTGTRA